MVEEEKHILDEKISMNKFAYIILKNNYYTNMAAEFQKFNSESSKKILKTRELEKNIIMMSKDEAGLKKSIQDIITHFVNVDNRNI